MQTIFRSTTGKTITVKHATERANDADHRFLVRCNILSVEIDGRDIGQTYLTEIDGHGLCIHTRFARGVNGKRQHIIVPIPAPAQADVQAIYDAYHAQVRREIEAEDKALEIERKIDANARRVQRAMDSQEDR
jgi:hypothetical protein